MKHNIFSFLSKQITKNCCKSKNNNKVITLCNSKIHKKNNKKRKFKNKHHYKHYHKKKYNDTTNKNDINLSNIDNNEINKYSDNNNILDEKKDEQLNDRLCTSLNKKNKRRRLPHGIRERVWVRYNGYKFNAKCNVSFCDRILTPFDFDVGHNIPVSKGGSDSIDNLRPICRVCNVSMSDKYTIDEYDDTFKIIK